MPAERYCLWNGANTSPFIPLRATGLLRGPPAEWLAEPEHWNASERRPIATRSSGLPPRLQPMSDGAHASESGPRNNIDGLRCKYPVDVPRAGCVSAIFPFRLTRLSLWPGLGTMNVGEEGGVLLAAAADARAESCNAPGQRALVITPESPDRTGLAAVLRGDRSMRPCPWPPIVVAAQASASAGPSAQCLRAPSCRMISIMGA
ncbi:hypothetical protein C8Q80DRAFT_290261 [Daedaleopsis nitida]|nr:hypothetical protein C8Q80DRAFT_290261 [Daedaleopsis nitida]